MRFCAVFCMNVPQTCERGVSWAIILLPRETTPLWVVALAGLSGAGLLFFLVLGESIA